VPASFGETAAVETASPAPTLPIKGNDYQTSILPNGYPVGTPQEALDCACGLYLNDAAAWQSPPN